MVQNEWFHCEVQGHEKRQKLRLTRDQVINGSVCHAKESYLVMKVLEFQVAVCFGQITVYVGWVEEASKHDEKNPERSMSIKN